MSEEEEQNRFSLRKLSIGLASVLVGVSIFGTSQTVKADTVADQNTSAVTSNAQSSDTQENKNAVKSTFSSDNQANNAKSNLIQTQVEGKKDRKQDSVPKTQETTDSSNLDAEKSIVRTSSLQESDNQSNNHAEDNSQTQNEQKLDLTKNSKKFAKKELATNLTQDNSTQNNDWADPARGIDPVKFASNGGFDPKIWGTMDTSKWQLDSSGNITGYTGDMSHIIIPDASDFAKAGKSYQQIGISSGEMQNLVGYNNSEVNTLAISLTDNKKVKATDAKWSSVFYSSTLKQANLEGLDTSNVTDMNFMFFNARSLTSLDGSNWDTSKVTDMNSMFWGASSLNSLDVSKWNTGKVTDMHYMFADASSLTDLDVSKWNTGNVTDMSRMFADASSLNSLDVSKWDTGNVTDMSLMFYYASSLISLDVSNWDTGKVTDMHWIFDGASSLMSLDVSNWDTSKVTDMSGMFQNASSLNNLDVSNWDTSKVTNMSNMFYDASSLNNLDVSNWDTSKVTNMSNMFDGASSLNSLDVSNWDTGKVTDMGNMFDDAKSLALIANSGKFADYLVNHDSFAKSSVDSGAKSVTTDNTKLLQLLTSDVQHNSANRTIVFTFPTNYSPDLAKYHLTKNGNTYLIKQSADYDKPYLQGTVLINATSDITEHHIDTTKPNKLSNTWQPNYDKLVLAHKNSDGSVSFDAIQLPKVPGYKAYIVPNKSNPALFTVSFIAVPTENKPSTPVEETPSKPSAPTDNSSNSAWTDLKHKVVNTLNQSDSGWTMPENNSTYTVEVPDDAIIDLSDLVIAEPVHAQTRTQIHVNKHFKLSKKHAIKHLKHRKKAVKSFKKYRL